MKSPFLTTSGKHLVIRELTSTRACFLFLTSGKINLKNCPSDLIFVRPKIARPTEYLYSGDLLPDRFRFLNYSFLTFLISFGGIVVLKKKQTFCENKTRDKT